MQRLPLEIFGSLSNGVDDLENFTSEMEWSFLFPSVSPVFFQIGTVPYQHRLRFRWVSIVMSTATGQSRGARDRDKVWNRALSPRAPGLLERQQASLPSESTWAERAAR
jgi:hypothetical protein